MRRVRPFVCLSAAGVAKPALGPDCAGTVVYLSSACGLSPRWLSSDPVPEQGHVHKLAPSGPGESFQPQGLALPLAGLDLSQAQLRETF